MSFLNLENKNILVTGVANKHSIATHVVRILLDEGASPVLVVQDDARRAAAAKLFPTLPILLCDVEKQDDIDRLGADVVREHGLLAGFVHSLAFANFSEGMKPFHETRRADFLQAMDIGMFSLVALSKALAPAFARDAAVVTMSICTTNMAAESYGYMAPVKAALDSAVAFLAKSFSAFSEVRFNAVNAGLLKTSASAGIPGYLDNYLYAEKAIPRKRALETREVANLAVFLLSPAASGINGQRHVIDAGMSINYFDRELVAPVCGITGN